MTDDTGKACYLMTKMPELKYEHQLDYEYTKTAQLMLGTVTPQEGTKT
jgi:hypothetical protein